MIQKFKKKPVVVEAIQWDERNFGEIFEFANVDGVSVVTGPNPYADGYGRKKLSITIETLEGAMVAWSGDWIIKGVEGEFYPCKPSIFATTYDLVEGF